MRKAKKFLSLLFSAVMALGLVLFTAQEAQAADISAGQTEFTVASSSSGSNTSVVYYFGHEWWVIGANGKGVASTPGTVTLLAKDDILGSNSFFRRRDPIAGPECQEYDTDEFYYGTGWTTPNEYKGSNLEYGVMDNVVYGFDRREYKQIVKRTLVGDGTDMKGPSVSDRMAWPLSKSECQIINNTDVLGYVRRWWLRSPGDGDTQAAVVNSNGSLNFSGLPVGDPFTAPRPALILNLDAVLVTSAADATSGKSSVTVGGNLVGASTPTSAMKFTVKDTSQTLNVSTVTKSGGTLAATYSGATVAADKQYISCVLTANNGNVKYYGKLAKVDTEGKASGMVQIPLAGVVDGTYTLKIFSEQANGDKDTDFCSEPVTMSISVADGIGTVTQFAGGTIHEHTFDQKILDKDKYLAASADCEKADTYYYSCVCGEKGTTTFTNGAARGHSWGAVGYNWNGVQSCTATRTCANNPAHVEDAIATIKSEVTTPATCTADGERTYTATFAETWAATQTETEQIAALGHDKVEHDAKDPTCTEVGWDAYEDCSRCDYTTYKEIAATGHSYGAEWKSDKDNHWHECAACGDKTDEAKHTPKTVNAKTATSTEKGYTDDTVCEVCGYEIAKGEDIPVISDPNNPRTGDNSKLPFWIALMFVSLAGVCGTALYGKKKKAVK